jgi:predicted DNA repair protein MutK
LVNALPKVIRGLEVIGTLALLLVAGGIFVHNIHAIHDAVHFMPSLLAEFLSGLLIGLLVLFLVMGFKKLLPQKPK